MARWQAAVIRQFPHGAYLLLAVSLVLGGCTQRPESTAKPSAESAPVAGTGGETAPPAAPTPAPEAPASASGAALPAAKNAVPPSGSSSQTGTAAAAAPSPAPVREIPAGTRIRIRTSSTLSTKSAQAGDPFEGSLAEAIVVDGQMIAPRGAPVSGVVSVSDPGGKVKGLAKIGIRVTAVDGMAVRTAPVSFQAKSAKKRDAIAIGATSGLGAAIGAIAGGGKGAAIGAGAGAGAGTAGVMMTRGEPAVIPAESVVTFTVTGLK